MTYELAKQLKDAGFPQDLTDESFKFMFADGSFMAGAFPTEKGDELSKIPTLSELIEACPKTTKSRFGQYDLILKVYDNETWLAAYIEYDSYDNPEGLGKTPEEAVAKLWLSLNRKN